MGILSSTGQLPRAAVPKWIWQENSAVDVMREMAANAGALFPPEPMSESLNVLVSNEQDPLTWPNLNAGSI